MTWDDCLALGATRLSQILGCPVTTAHSWITRSATGKSPAQWERQWLIPVVEAAEATRKAQQAAALGSDPPRVPQAGRTRKRKS